MVKGNQENYTHVTTTIFKNIKTPMRLLVITR